MSVWKSLEAIGTLYSAGEKYLLASKFYLKALEYYTAYSRVFGKCLMIESRLIAKKNTSLKLSETKKCENVNILSNTESFESIIEIDEKGRDKVEENNINTKISSERQPFDDQNESLVILIHS